VADESAVLRMRDTIGEQLAPPDIVVANAVVQYAWTSVLEQANDDYRSQFESSVLHNVNLAKAFVPHMRKQGWGRYIGINTECTMQCHPTQSAYIAGKAGMDRVLRVLAKEVGGDQVTVNQVAPGWMISETRPDSSGAAGYKEQVPLRRRGTDQDIGHAVAFLASELANFITGVYLPV
jgi:3-oxoacyl-[acyl-carrier protein] reductase